MKKKILVIDDEESVRHILEKILHHAGYVVYTARNGVDALKKLEKIEADLIMLDMLMPKMNGIEFLKAMRLNEMKEIPVLMITGSADMELMIQCYKLGVYDFIKKPEDSEVMLKRIENGLKIGDMINFNRSIRSELIMANKLQSYLFPVPWAAIGRVNIFVWSKPVSDIGGDLYDYILLNNGKIIFFVCDVSGHGISAALYTVMVKMIFRNAIKETMVPGEIMTKMNNEICGNIPVESFVTMFCGLYDPEEMAFEYSNAGHPMPYLLTDNGVVEMEGNGPFLGPIKDVKFKNYQMDLNKCRGMIVYTDGVLDIINNKHERIGKRILLEILNDKNTAYREKFNFMQKNLINDNVLFYDDSTVFLMNFQ